MPIPDSKCVNLYVPIIVYFFEESIGIIIVPIFTLQFGNRYIEPGTNLLKLNIFKIIYFIYNLFLLTFLSASLPT